ncbi:hypothetical protein M413DRAFT_448276 [Hebeloma cylindrosporum]|uniref:Uncharacterized protein n=1 Tax=Hebeloma cylindrosporum TaxID=76867 RepID=A0A0C3BM26_HEBCY|nr:hypothetical protein M413DRAFT_448276 [Hebeloma cylindrosporum h7]
MSLERWHQTISDIFKGCEHLRDIHFASPNTFRTYRWTEGSLDLQPTVSSYQDVQSVSPRTRDVSWSHNPPIDGFFLVQPENVSGFPDFFRSNREFLARE